MNAVADHPHEIIIVKHRGGDHEDAHHGGAWKIAFADFMTAMMCFFLVMWLINAANEETKVAVASYFNPVKLIDRNANRRGLEDLGSGPQTPEPSQSESEAEGAKPDSKGMETSGPSQHDASKDKEETEKASDHELFSDPYAVLAEIAGDSGEAQNISDKGEGGAQVAGPATGASGGEAYRDPFAPDFWSQEVVPTPATSDNGGKELGGTSQNVLPGNAPSTALPGETSDPFAPHAVATPEEAPLPEPRPEPAEIAKHQSEAAAKAEKTAEESKPEAEAKAHEQTEQPKPEADVAPTPETVKAAAEIGKEIHEALGDKDLLKGISIVPAKEGVKISLTDQLDYGMFEIGSAVPRRDLVLAMEKIARILAERGGKIAIHGHTDGRPFAGKTYDNWRLSTARAHSAYYMLARAGLDEKRIVEVAGYADRELRLPDKPLDASNRRIEILLETGG